MSAVVNEDHDNHDKFVDVNVNNRVIVVINGDGADDADDSSDYVEVC